MPLAVTGFFRGLSQSSSSSSSSSSTSSIHFSFLGLDVSSLISSASLLFPDFFSILLPFGFSVSFVPETLAPLFTSSSRSFCLRVHSSDSLILNFPVYAPPLYLVPMMYLCSVLSIVANRFDRKTVGTCCSGIILSIKYLYIIAETVFLLTSSRP